jgi:hypothetical protein
MNSAQKIHTKAVHLPPQKESEIPFPDVVKLVDTSDLGSDAVRCGGSSPSIRTKNEH